MDDTTKPVQNQTQVQDTDETTANDLLLKGAEDMDALAQSKQETTEELLANLEALKQQYGSTEASTPEMPQAPAKEFAPAETAPVAPDAPVTNPGYFGTPFQQTPEQPAQAPMNPMGQPNQ